MFRLREKNDSQHCEDPRHDEKKAKGRGGRRAIGVIETAYDSYAICKSCFERIERKEKENE